MEQYDMWGKKAKEQRLQETEKHQKEMQTIEHRLSRVEIRLRLLADKVNVISRQNEEKNT